MTYCTNCGTKIRKEDNFCHNCGIKIEKNDNFCTNCGAKLEKEDKFCTNCGTKIDKSYIKENNLKSVPDYLEKTKKEKEEIRNARIKERVRKAKEKEKIRIAKEKKEEKKIQKRLDELFESDEIKSEIRKNKINQIYLISIKDNLKYELIHEKDMNEEEIKDSIKQKLKKAKKEQRQARIAKEEAISRKIETTEIVHGGYCSLNCRHCYEEFWDDGGGIVGDFDSGGYVEYYCNLGHSVSLGSFCEDYD